MTTWIPLPFRLAVLAENDYGIAPLYGLVRFGPLGAFEIEQLFKLEPTP